MRGTSPALEVLREIIEKGITFALGLATCFGVECHTISSAQQIGTVQVGILEAWHRQGRSVEAHMTHVSVVNCPLPQGWQRRGWRRSGFLYHRWGPQGDRGEATLSPRGSAGGTRSVSIRMTCRVAVLTDLCNLAVIVIWSISSLAHRRLWGNEVRPLAKE